MSSGSSSTRRRNKMKPKENSKICSTSRLLKPMSKSCRSRVKWVNWRSARPPLLTRNRRLMSCARERKSSRSSSLCLITRSKNWSTRLGQEKGKSKSWTSKRQRCRMKSNISRLSIGTCSWSCRTWKTNWRVFNKSRSISRIKLISKWSTWSSSRTMSTTHWTITWATTRNWRKESWSFTRSMSRRKSTITRQMKLMQHTNITTREDTWRRTSITTDGS